MSESHADKRQKRLKQLLDEDGINKLIAANFWTALGVFIRYLFIVAIGSLICRPINNLYFTFVFGVVLGGAIIWNTNRIFVGAAFLATAVATIILGWSAVQLGLPHSALVVMAATSGVNIMLTLKMFRRFSDEIRGKTPR